MNREKTKSDKRKLDKIVGNNIRLEREARKMTREELAEVIDITVSHLGLIERGERGATPVTLGRLVAAFGVTTDSLFTPSSKSVSAKEENKPNPYFKKVSTLITRLTEAELEILCHTIKGLMSARATDKAAFNDDFGDI